MQVPIQIDFHGLEPSGFIEQRIRERAAKLPRFYERIVSCRVTVEAPHHHHRQGNLYAVHIALSVPGDTLIVNRDHGQDRAHADVYVAIRDAFDAAERRLEEHSHRPRGLRPTRPTVAADSERA